MKKDLPTLLVCDDDQNFYLTIQYCCEGKFDVLYCENTDQANEILKIKEIDLLLLDVKIRSFDEGLNFISIIKESEPDLPIIMASGSTEFETVRKAMKLGAWDYLSKSFEKDELIHLLDQAIERRGLLQKSERQKKEAELHHSQIQLIGSSESTKQLRRMVQQVQESASNVLIFGETGTGKEVIAKLLRSRSADGSFDPFFTVDCALLNGVEAEVQLFGEERELPNGIRRQVKGVFEAAHRGTVFFDEITNIPVEIQAKLLRVLEEKVITRRGSLKSVRVNFRVIGSTSKNIIQSIKDGKFSHELFQRLNVIPIELIPLRDRKDEIPELIDYFIKKLPSHQNQFKLSADAIEVLKAYSWPGNIRELSNVIGYIATFCELNGEIEVSDLPPRIRAGEKVIFDRPTLESSQDNAEKFLGFYNAVSLFEKDYLARELDRARGNISRMAAVIGMDRTYLYTKLREHSLYPRKEYK